MDIRDFPPFAAANWEGLPPEVTAAARWQMFKFFGDDLNFPGYRSVTYTMIDTGSVHTSLQAFQMEFGRAKKFLSGNWLNDPPGLAVLYLSKEAYWSEEFLEFLDVESLSDPSALAVLTALRVRPSRESAESVLLGLGFKRARTGAFAIESGDDDDDALTAIVAELDDGRIQVYLVAEDMLDLVSLNVTFRFASLEALRVAVDAAITPWLEDRGILYEVKKELALAAKGKI